jgi:hypothetical protein
MFAILFSSYALSDTRCCKIAIDTISPSNTEIRKDNLIKGCLLFILLSLSLKDNKWLLGRGLNLIDCHLK